MIFITGATGLVGSHIALELLQRSEEVRCLHRSNSDLEHLEKLFQFLDPQSGALHFSKINWVDGDVLDILSLQDAMSGCTQAVHAAAVVSYHKRDRSTMYKVNVEGTANVMNVALQCGLKKVCHISSIASLSRKENNQLVYESDAWADAGLHTNYGISKHQAELEVMRTVQEGLNAFMINPGFVIGAGQSGKSSGQLIKILDRGISFYSPGGTGAVAARDVALCVAELLKKDVTGERFTGVAENISFREISDMICSLLGKKSPQRMASPMLLKLAAFASWLLEKVSGRKAIITVESVKNAELVFSYSNKKIIRETGVNFRTVKSAVEEAVEYFKQNRTG